MLTAICDVAFTILSNPLLLNLITLLITIITLVIVIFQTVYTRNSLEEARKSVELTKTSRQIETLPRLNFIIHVTMILNNWNDEIKEAIKFLEEKNINEIIKISKKSIKPAGLLDKYMFDKMPDWLSVIYSTGAQYYYNSSCLYQYLWNEKKDKLVNHRDYLDRFRESSYYLEVLLKYIKDEVPQVFLESPASVSINDFFKLN